MSGSTTSVPPSPPILKYVLSVGGLVTSLMLTTFGLTNNAWVVVSRPFELDEFQRGIRGHDCYKDYSDPRDKNIKCLPWEYENKTIKFPEPFERVMDASIVVHVAGYFAMIIILTQVFWLTYTVGHCCSLEFSRRTMKFKLIFFHVMVFSVGLWIMLFFGIVYEVYTDQILPRYMKKSEYETGIGSGCWMFFLGGMVPYMISLYCLFSEEMEASKQKLNALIRRHQRLPTNEEEMMPR